MQEDTLRDLATEIDAFRDRLRGECGCTPAGDHCHVERSGPRPAIRRSVREAVYRRDGRSCRFCGSSNRIHLDHIVPWSAGGTDTSHNLRVLCASHNSSRSNRCQIGDDYVLPCAWACNACAPDWVAEILDRGDHLELAFCAWCEQTNYAPCRQIDLDVRRLFELRTR